MAELYRAFTARLCTKCHLARYSKSKHRDLTGQENTMNQHRNPPFNASLRWGAALALAALSAGAVQAQEVLARVISSTAVIQQVAVPRQQCTTAPVVSQSAPSGAGAIMGAIAGGAMGNAVGDGTGRALATMIGVMGGAMVGNNVEGTKSQVQNVQQCTTQTTYENRIRHYDVVYEYADKRYSIQMPNDPGQTVRLQLSPIGTMPPQSQAPQVPVQPQTYQQYQPFSQADVIYTQPTTTVYVQPAPVVYQTAYARPYIQPFYAPIGVSLNLGYSRGFGHHHHWR